MKAKLFILALLCFCLTGSGIAQNGNNKRKLYGIIKDSESGNPLEFATAVLLKGSDNKVVTSSMADQKGLFMFNDVPAGNYKLKITFVGYLDAEKEIQVNESHKEVNADVITLQPASNQLSAAVVTARVPTIERKIDKLVMNVEGALSTEGNTAMEVLKKAPGVTVDQDGNIKLLGGGVLVQVDGRNTYLSSADLATLLEGMNASEISKIEIVNSPSSSQDASGGSGIINIRTRKSVMAGINGTASAGTTISDYTGANGGLRLNYRSEKIGAYASYDYRHNAMTNDIDQIRNFHAATPPSVYESKSENVFKSDRGNYRVGLDYYINQKNTLGILVTGNNSSGTSLSNANTNTSTTSGVISKSIANNSRDDNNNGFTINTNYKKLFNKEGQSLSFDLDYIKFNNKQNEFQNNHFYNLITNRDSLLKVHSYSPRKVEVLSGKTDYNQIIGTTMQLEAGAKISHSKTNSELDWKDNYTGVWIPNNKRSNEFKYTERVSAVYVSLAKQFSAKLSAKAGLRWENTWSEGDSPSTGKNKVRSYNDFFPTVFLQYKPTEKHDFTIMYNRRIQRPDYDNLNPFRSYLDPYTYISGNEDLKPQYTDNINFTHSYKNMLITSLFYKRETDLIVQIPEQRDDIGESGVIQGNFGYSNMIGLNIALPYFPLNKWWILSTNAWGGWLHNHSIQDAVIYDDYTFMGQLSLSNNFTIANTWKIEVSGNVSSPMSWGYFKIKPQIWHSIGIKKSFMDNKINLSINIDDPFKLQNNKMDVKYDKFDYHYDTRWSSQRVRIGLTWRFGSNKIKPIQDRKVGSEDELNRIKTN